MFNVLAYIKFLLHSTSQHGVHSPFVYNLVTKCFYDKKKYRSYNLLKQFRQSLLKDNRKIKVTDFGAGSRVFKSEERKVSKIAKTAGISPKRAQLLNRLVRYLEVENALELGTSVGLATAAMTFDNTIQVTTIEGCPETAKIAGEKFEEFKLKNVVLKVGKFEEEIQNSKFQIPNSFETGNRQPITDNSQPETSNRQQETNSKSQIPNSKLSSNTEPAIDIQNSKFKIQDSEVSKTNELETDNNPQLTTDHRQQATDFQNSKFEIQDSGVSKTNELETDNPQLITDNREPATGNRKQIPNSKSQIPNFLQKQNTQLATRNPKPTTPNPDLLTHHFDLLYIDGNHQKDATIDYFQMLLPNVHNDSVMIFDDIHWSKGMEEAWEEIKLHPSARVTIDTFQWGLVFFRREQEKEHFVIRV